MVSFHLHVIQFNVMTFLMKAQLGQWSPRGLHSEWLRCGRKGDSLVKYLELLELKVLECSGPRGSGGAPGPSGLAKKDTYRPVVSDRTKFPPDVADFDWQE